MNFDKIKIFENFDKNRDSLRKFLTKFDDLKNLARIKIVCRQIEHSKNFDQNRNFQKFWLELRFSENFDQNHILGKFLPKSWFFDNIDENQGSSKLLNEIEIFENFDQNWDYLKKIDQHRNFQFFFTEIEIISENADKHRNFS